MARHRAALPLVGFGPAPCRIPSRYYNLTRVMNILGVKPLIAAIQT
jgi:hypothetical protein